MRRVLVLLLAGSGLARADTDPSAAKAEAAAAERHAAAQDYERAATRFREAHRLDPRPEYLCNVGVAYQRAKRLMHAQIYLVECLRRGTTLDATFIDLVRKALGAVEAKLRAGEFAPVDFVVQPEGAIIAASAFEADETFIGSRVVWLPFGSHSIMVSAEGYKTVRRTIEVHSRAERRERFELERTTNKRTPSGDRGDGDAEPKTMLVPPSNTPAIIATIGTAAVAVTAIWAYSHASSIMDGAASPALSRLEYDAIVDRARTWQHTSWLLAGLAGAGAVASAWLWYRTTRSWTLEVSAGDDGAAAMLSGSW